MRLPDYDKMRIMVAEVEAENMDGNELVEILYSGYDGYKYESDEDIMDIFLQLHEGKDIPKIKLEVNKQQCKECGYLVCVCKPVTFYTPKAKRSNKWSIKM